MYALFQILNESKHILNYYDGGKNKLLGMSNLKKILCKIYL